jgi:hypothetical protein
MRKLKNYYIVAYFFILAGVFFGCKKDAKEISDIPEIKLIEVTPTQIREYKDKVVFNIYYKDGNGDIGENKDAVKNLFITDSRNSITYQLRVKQLAPDGADVAIEGNLMVELNNAAILDGSSSQAVVYSIYLKDRAGNASNTVSSTGIRVVK